MDLLLQLVGIIVIVIGIAVSIGLHELGHFLPARRFGVYVGKFMIGFGPTIWSRKKGETEFGLKAIPLGGFVSLSGMYPPTESQNGRGFTWFRKLVQDARDASAETIIDDSRSFYRQSVWKRLVIMLGGPLANLIIAAVLYVVLFSGIGVLKTTTTISSVSECVIPVSETRDTCGRDDPLSPANIAGIQPGDRVVSINSIAVTDWDSGMDIIRESAGVPQDFTVERNGSLLDLQVTPIAAERYAVAEDGTIVVDSEGNPRTRTVGFIGIAPKIERQQQSPLVAFQSLGDNVAQVGSLVLQLPQKVYQVAESAFGNKKRDINGPISVVGVGRIAGEITSSADFDLGSRFAALIGILASLNIALFVFNLLPLLPLDGGHIVVALWEGTRNWIQRLRGKPSLPPLDTAKLVPITVAVTVLLVGVSALLIYADIVKPITL